VVRPSGGVNRETQHSLVGSGHSGSANLSTAFLVIAILAVAALILPKLLRNGRPADVAPDAEDPAGLALESEARLDPTPYRRQIVQLEQQLYSERPGGFDDADRVSGLARELSMAVRGDGRDLTRSQAFGKLFDYAGEVGVQADVGYTTANLPALRSRWEQVRNEAFAPAEWFRNSTPALTAAQSPSQPVVDQRTVQGLRDAAVQLEQMIRRGRREALSIPEAGVDAALNTAEARRAEQQWRSWSDRWLRDLDGVARYMPSTPSANADVNVTMAYQELSRALGELRLVQHSAASTTTIPFKYEREQRFESASRYVEQAREYLDKVG
jgi:hypothetical protein